MAEYKHGTYGEFVGSIGHRAAQSGTVAVYVGVAPVNLVRGYANSVNVPVKLSSMEDAQRYCGYSENWAAFDLCEAFALHFNNTAGNIGPIVAINVLDPATHKKADEVTTALAFVNGRATITSDTIILDTLVLDGKVEGADFSIDYDFARGQVVINSIGTAITGSVNATYSEVDTSKIAAADIIGGVTANGVYAGLGCVGLIYQTLNVIPNLIVCPAWGEKPNVYTAMVVAGSKINGHWDAFIYADIPLSDGGEKVDTIDAAIAWKSENGYTSERSKVFWPRAKDAQGNEIHGAVVAAWRTVMVDAENEGVPMETPSNKAVPVVCQFFGAETTNRGFDIQQGNKLNAAGITTVIYWGGQWILWGPHTAAFTHGANVDGRAIFDNSMRMMMHVSNSFQADWAIAIDQPMSRALADTIKAQEQEKLDAWANMGAFIGTPVVEFKETSNSTDEIMEGNFVWESQGTPTPPFKSGTLKVAYSAEGYNSYFGEVQ